MIRITLGGDELRDFPTGFAGGYVKLILPPPTATSKAVIRTYTIRHQDKEAIDVDFALHGDKDAAGLATRWALDARPGLTLEVGGPGQRHAGRCRQNRVIPSWSEGRDCPSPCRKVATSILSPVI